MMVLCVDKFIKGIQKVYGVYISSGERMMYTGLKEAEEFFEQVSGKGFNIYLHVLEWDKREQRYTAKELVKRYVSKADRTYFKVRLNYHAGHRSDTRINFHVDIEVYDYYRTTEHDLPKEPSRRSITNDYIVFVSDDIDVLVGDKISVDIL